MKTAMQRNLRYHLRIPADFIAHLFTGDGQTVETPINNISRAGLMLSCTRATLEDLVPNGAALSPLKAIHVRVDFSLPLEQEGLVAMSQQMEIIYTRRLSKDEYAIGLEFRQLGLQQRLILEQYIKENKGRLKSCQPV